MPLELSITLNAPLERALPPIERALQDQGFEIVSRLDERAALHPHGAGDRHPLLILGFYHPRLAHQALQIDARVGLLLPCTLTLHQTPAGMNVQALDPRRLYRLAPQPAQRALQTLASDASARLRQALTKLAAQTPAG